MRIAHQDQMRTGRFNATGMKTALRFKLVVAVTALSTQCEVLIAVCNRKKEETGPKSRTLSAGERECIMPKTLNSFVSVLLGKYQCCGFFHCISLSLIVSHCVFIVQLRNE